MRVDTLDTRQGLPIWPLLIMALALVAAGVLTITVENGRHSVARHGAEAIQIQRILDDPCQGSHSQWQSRSWRTPNKFFQTCQLNDGRWGFRIIDKIRGKWNEKTSFVPGDGSKKHLLEYLTAIAKEVKQ